jgi:hypothetical protein
MEALATYGTATDASAAATALANVAEFAGYADASDVDYDALEATAEKNALASC